MVNQSGSTLIRDYSMALLGLALPLPLPRPPPLSLTPLAMPLSLSFVGIRCFKTEELTCGPVIAKALTAN